MHDRSCLTLSSPPRETDFKQEAPTYLEEGEVDNGILYSLIMYHCKPLFVLVQIYMCAMQKLQSVYQDLFNIDVKSTLIQNT